MPYMKKHRIAGIVAIISFVILSVLLIWLQTREHNRHRHSEVSPVTHREMVREAGRQLKEELASLPDSGITNKTTEAQILIAYGRRLKELQAAKAELAMLRGNVSGTATAEANQP